MSGTVTDGQVVVIGLDAGDINLIEEWAAAGVLPTFSGLFERAAHGRLETTSEALQGSVWPSLVTGCHPGKHGSYYRQQIRPGTTEIMHVRGDHCLRPPFWSWLAGDRETVVVIDVPKTAPHEGISGLQVVEWGAWDGYWDYATSPPEAAAGILTEFGRHPFLARPSPPRTTRQRLRLGRRLVDGVALKNRLNLGLLRRLNPRLLLSVFGETHPAGHFLWGRDEGGRPDELRSALRDVYRAVDGAIGELLQALNGRADVMIVSGHGFGPDHTPDFVLPELLRRMGVTVAPASSGGEPQALSLKQRARRLVPRAVRHAVYRRTVPADERERRSLRAVMSGIDFARSRAFCLPTDLQGFIRLNLQGREPTGCVAPEEYETLCDELEAELRSLENAANGEPVVEQVFRMRQTYADGDCLEYLPDLCVLWNQDHAIPGVRSPQYGAISAPQRRAERLGHHRPRGFFFALGPSIDCSVQGVRGHVLDLAPTVFRLLGKEVPEDWDGEALPVQA